MRAARIDANHTAIVKALRQAGATVQSLAGVGDGVPDLLVGIAGKTALLECKDGKKVASKQKLTPAQLEWHAAWQGGTLAVVDSPEAALRAIGVMKGTP